MDDLLLHLERKTAEFIADSDCNDPSLMCSLAGGGNRLTVTSAGNVKDDRMLKQNDVEVVTKSSLKAYAQTVVQNGTGPSTAETDTIKFVGSGSVDSPIEALARLPSATDGIAGIVKVVHEGSHGFPCPGFSSSSTAVAFDGMSNSGIMLRNGADDLETDVFISYLEIAADNSSITCTPTADRFRIPALPATAKPIRAEHASNGVILLQTTDGPFFIFTNDNIDINKWKVCRINNQELQSLQWSYFPIFNGNNVYIVKTYVDTGNGAHVELYKSAYANQTVIQLVKVNLTGVNFSGTAQNGQRFALFNKIVGEPAEKPMVTNPEKDLRSITVTRLKSDYWHLEGDCYDFCVSGNRVRVLHRNTVNGYAALTSDTFFANCQVSYVVDFVNNTVSVDNPSRYPAVLNYRSSTINDGQMAGATSADWDNRILRIGKHTLCYNAYTRLAFPNLVVATNASSVSDFDNLIAGQGAWSRKCTTNAGGLYGSPLRMNYIGIMPIGNDCFIGRDATGTRLKIRYDPYGSYSPLFPGYGPTNEREVIDSATYNKFKYMCWVFDGDKNKVAGGRLNERNLSSPTTYENGVFGNPVSIALVDHNRLIEDLTNAVPNAPSGIVSKHLTLDVFHERDVPVIAMLTLVAPNPSSPTINLSYAYFFTLIPNTLQGKITSWNNIRFISSVKVGDYVKSVAGMNIEHAGTAGAYKLLDGNWAMSTLSHAVSVTGNTQYALVRVIYNPTSKVFSGPKSSVHGLSQPGNYIGTKELGFGSVESTRSGESCYLLSYGNTSAEINAGTSTKYTLVMTRTDAGDNVTVSQYGATVEKERIESLIPPTRKINNMDLSRDRIVTSANIGAGRVPNQQDSTYPLQQKHRDSVIGLSVINHTHKPSVFTMAAATTDRYGGSALGNMDSGPDVAFRVEDITNLSQQLDTLHNRETLLTKTDPTVNVDYEV